MVEAAAGNRNVYQNLTPRTTCAVKLAEVQVMMPGARDQHHLSAYFAARSLYGARILWCRKKRHSHCWTRVKNFAAQTKTSLERYLMPRRQDSKHSLLTSSCDKVRLPFSLHLDHDFRHNLGLSVIRERSSRSMIAIA